MLPFVHTLDVGLITDVLRAEARAWRQDPGQPLPAEITHLTGLTDEDLAGQQIDVTAADDLITRSHLVVAHNAAFDRPCTEQVIASAQGAAWACSRHEVGFGTPPSSPRARSRACCAPRGGSVANPTKGRVGQARRGLAL